MIAPVLGVLFDGLAYGMLLFLLSVGLSVTLGMMNFVNLAHCSFAMLGGYDGMHLIYEALKKTGGKADGESLINAAKGMAWESPRGPMSIDPETRDVIQTIYIRRVEKVGGNLVNVEFDKVENVKDPVKAAMKK
jgi:hypothetical protein